MSNDHQHTGHNHQHGVHANLDNCKAGLLNVDAEALKKAPGMVFPCSFPIKAFGKTSNDLVEHIHKLISQHVDGLELDMYSCTRSAKGNYTAVTVTIMATSREQLDAIYSTLQKDERVIARL